MFAELFKRTDDYLADPSYAGDHCTSDGAERLAHKIAAFWRERGESVEVKLVRQEFNPAVRSARTDIRSDMVNGLPRLRPLPSPENDNG